MKTNRPILVLTGLALLAIVVLLDSCSKSSDPAKPTSTFTYTADGKSVTFANTSKNATSYAWDFGDGGTSTEQNPTHVYATYGTYTVKLAATGAGGTTNSLPDAVLLSKTSDIAIDGTFTDWASIPVAATATAEDGSLLTLKMDYDGLKLYAYVEGTANMKGYFDIYINADNDTTTGANYVYTYHAMGADYLVDGYIGDTKDADLYADNPNQDTWCWTADCTAATPTPILAVGNGFVTSSDLKTSGDKKIIEFSMLRAPMTKLGTIATFGFTDVDAGGTWSTIGSVPVTGTPTSLMFALDLTK